MKNERGKMKEKRERECVGVWGRGQTIPDDELGIGHKRTHVTENIVYVGAYGIRPFKKG